MEDGLGRDVGPSAVGIPRSIRETFLVFSTKTTGLNARYSFEADDRQSTRERTLSGP